MRIMIECGTSVRSFAAARPHRHLLLQAINSTPYAQDPPPFVYPVLLASFSFNAASKSVIYE